ncbi:MAG: DUF3857 domain-containing protein [Bacteroidales bacterium]|nr:DUF3857 domain-containing protein [Bacteroidales bacterium]MBN2763701.1 DUF3857 domain-containing protein [Bacteroidales bacterium]
MKKTFILLSIILVYTISFLTAQPVPARYGKIDMADLEMKVYDLDTTAEAVILCDFGEFNPNTFDFTRLLRIKVLKKEGSDIVNRVLYITGNSAIKGCTYNLVDGEVVKSKLKNESIFKEQVRDDRYRYRITMPDVRVGSVVEMQYTFPLLPEQWRFQDRVPVRWSELRINDSPYVTFQKVFYGFEPLYINESGRWVGKDMPALRTEPYVNSLTNYLTKVEIELSNIIIPGYTRFFTSSWDAVNRYLLDHQYFGDALGMALFLNDDAKTIKELNLPDIEKMKVACDTIRKKVKWNDNESVYTTGDLGIAYRKGSGNSAEVNLILVQLLKKLDFEAFPVALSTRENGFLSPSFPTIDKLNYIVAGVKYNGKNYLFDATEPCLPAGMLPFRALNGRGRIIDNKYSDWIDLYTDDEQKETVYCDMKLDETGEITGTINYTDAGYEAYYFRNNLRGHNSHDEYIRELESNFPGLTVNSYAFEDADSLHKPVKEQYEVSLTGYTDAIGDMISISPMFIERKDSNPFKMTVRKYPIDYGHEIKSRYMLKIELPEGYEVIDIPKPCNITLPDKSARYTYQALLKGNFIQLNANFEINKPVFVESEYHLIKEFYNQVIAKQAEVVMLKKKT